MREQGDRRGFGKVLSGKDDSVGSGPTPMRIRQKAGRWGRAGGRGASHFATIYGAISYACACPAWNLLYRPAAMERMVTHTSYMEAQMPIKRDNVLI
jgi:hypothetical protein